MKTINERINYRRPFLRSHVTLLFDRCGIQLDYRATINKASILLGKRIGAFVIIHKFSLRNLSYSNSYEVCVAYCLSRNARDGQKEEYTAEIQVIAFLLGANHTRAVSYSFFLSLIFSLSYFPSFLFFVKAPCFLRRTRS